MRIVFIGGTRFIGAASVRRLAALGHEVLVFHRGDSNAALPASVVHVRGDRRDIAARVADFRAFRPEVVVDMIAHTEDDARATLDAFRGCARRLLAISSEDVYRARDKLCRVQPGPPDPIPLDEGAPLREVLFPYRTLAKGPDDPKYTYDKIPMERAAKGDAMLPATVLRLPAVYGPEDYQRRVREYLRPMDEGQDEIVLDERVARWRWTRGYVEDVADAVARCTTDERAAGRTYNIGEADALEEREWVLAIARAAGWAGRIRVVARGELPEAKQRELDDHDFSQHWVIDTRRIREELGWRELATRDEALERTVAWERAQAHA